MTFASDLAPRYVFPDAFAAVLLEYAEPLKQDDIVSQLRDAIGPAPRIRSLRHLSRLQPDPAVLLGVRTFLQNESDPAVLAAACSLLGSMAPSNSARNLLLDLVDHQHLGVQAAALQALRRFGASDALSSLMLAKANSSSDGRILSIAVRTLMDLRPDLSWTLVQSALVTPSSGDIVARTALEFITLDLIDSKKLNENDVYDTVRPLMDPEHSVLLRTAALETFARIDPEGVTVRRTVLLWSQDGSEELRAAAFRALSTWPDIKVSTDALYEAWQTEPSLELRSTIKSLISARS